MPFSGRTMSLERCKRILKELHQLGVPYVTFSGGEPFLHPHILDVLDDAVRYGFSVTVNTNGLYFVRSSHMVEYITHLGEGVKLVNLSISLDSAIPADNNSARGAAAHVMVGVDNVLQLGLPVCLSTVVHRRNLASALSVVDRFYPAVTSFKFFRIVPTRQTTTHPELLLSNSEFHSFCKAVEAVRQSRPGIHVTLPLRELAARDIGTFEKEVPFCYCGFSKAYIDPDGDVYPCSYTSTATLCMGCIDTHGFDDIWRSPAAEAVRKLAIGSSLCGMTAGANDNTAVRYRSLDELPISKI